MGSPTTPKAEGRVNWSRGEVPYVQNKKGKEGYSERRKGSSFSRGKKGMWKGGKMMEHERERKKGTGGPHLL